MTDDDPKEQEPLVLRFGGSLVEQLGAQLYPSATATVAELISNAWDADARNVWVTIPFGSSWTENSEILVVDDGLGMNRDQAQERYLVVGRKRRVADGRDTTPSGRKVHGRKGIGKLAAFGTARILQCLTVSDKGAARFELDYDEIRKLEPTEDAKLDELPLKALVDPGGNKLETGTEVRLTKLYLRRALAKQQFMTSMSRRFSISSDKMAVWINGDPLKRFDIDVEFRFPRDSTPDGVEVAADGWGEEVIPGAGPVRWWIGFTKMPLTDNSLQGLSILARQKMAQRPFKFESVQGTEGQLGQEYLVGEVQAEWLDTGFDIEDDLIQSNRDQLQLEDQRLDPFMNWGRRRLGWALRERNRLRREKAEDAYERSAELDALLANMTKREKGRFDSLAKIAAKLPEQTPEGVVDLMRTVIDAQADNVVRQMMEDIEEMDEEVQTGMWRLVQEFGLIDARRNATLIEARLATIDKLEAAVKTGMREVPHIHDIVRLDPWLLDPRWHLLDDEVDTSKFGITFEPETDDETGNILDFLFVLTPEPPANIDEVIVVEIKRGTYPSGKERKVSEAEINKFESYVLDAHEHYEKQSPRPAVRGLMIAQDYTSRAMRARRVKEQAVVPRMEFKTWDAVIDETQRMHKGWLHVSKRRADTPPTAGR